MYSTFSRHKRRHARCANHKGCRECGCAAETYNGCGRRSRLFAMVQGAPQGLSRNGIQPRMPTYCRLFATRGLSEVSSPRPRLSIGSRSRPVCPLGNGLLRARNMPTTRGRKPRDGRRARKATANRILTVLRAILNRAFEKGLVADDTPWRRVKPFKRTRRTPRAISHRGRIGASHQR